MKIFDRTTGNEIFPRTKSRSAGTDRVIECFLKTRGDDITNIIFGATSRGCINGGDLPRNLVFNGCKFNYVSFDKMSDCTFINCNFEKCTFIGLTNVTMKDCTGFDSDVGYSSAISGKCEFTNCHGIRFDCNVSPDVELILNDTPALDELLKYIEERKRLAEEARLRNLELRKSVKYGYKVVTAPVLVKLSFPDYAELVNLDKDKSRASVAMVESVHVVNDFGAEGVTNRSYKPCRYEVGQLVYPDSYDPDPNQDCGHGIHFCKDIESLQEYGSLTSEQIESIKSQNL